MGSISFGTKQVSNPTPAKLERFVKIWIGISGLILAWMPTNNLVPHHVQDIITPLNNLINSILIFLLPFFGVETERKTVPVEDVVVMESKSK